MTERIKISAVVLRTVDYGDSDRVVTLLSRERGKVAAFARGARASRRRFAGALEPFTLLDAELVGRGGSDLARLESASVARPFLAVRGDLARIACAAYAVEVARELVRDDEPHVGLFDLLVDYLGRLDAAPAAPSGLRAFELGALAAVGFQPRFDRCARCGGEVAEAGRGAPFSAVDGGLLCRACSGGAPAPGGTWLGPEALAAVRRLQATGLDGAGAPLSPAVGREIREVLGRFLEHLVGHRLQARRFLDEVGHLFSE